MKYSRGFLRILAFVSVLFLAVYGFTPSGKENNGTYGSNHSHQGEPGEYPTPYPDRINITWTGDPATSFAVTWRTDSTVGQGQAHIAPATPAPQFYRHAETFDSEITRLKSGNVEASGGSANYHTVVFEELKPNTLYAYKVGHDEHWSEWFQFRTASKGQKPFSFIYVGDAQNGILSHWSRSIRTAYAEEPAARFVVHAGDLVNRAHRNVEWGRWNRAGAFIQSKLPGIAVPGNHEYESYTEGQDEEKLSIHWRPQFEFPHNGPEGLEETVYYLDYQGMRIIALNSNEQIDKQTQWLERVLQDNPNRWTVVTHHHPIYSSGEGRNNEKLRSSWQPVYNKYGVDLVMQGHDHTYARGQTENIAGGVNVKDTSSGTAYVNSVSGAKMYDLGKEGWKSFGGEMQRSAENTQLYQIVHVSTDTMKYRAYTVTGELYDAFDLVQQEGQKANKMIEKTVEVQQRTFDNTIPYD
ncbi:MAG: metallophosphoesterase family protein [Marinilabilia sp.]